MAEHDSHALRLTRKEQLTQLLQISRRIAVVGIKPDSYDFHPAHYVPRYMKDAGYEIIPVPSYYPDVTKIMGLDVVRDLKAIEGPVDIVNLFRRSEDVPGHLADILAIKPRAVWMQQGISHEGVAQALVDAGIQVIQDRCIMVDHRMSLS